MSDKVFADGFYFNEPRQNAPDFVIGSVSVKIDAAIPFLQANANDKGYVNLDVKRSKKGEPYVELNTWTPKNATQRAAQSAGKPDPYQSEPNDEIPF